MIRYELAGGASYVQLQDALAQVAFGQLGADGKFVPHNNGACAFEVGIRGVYTGAGSNLEIR